MEFAKSHSNRAAERIGMTEKMVRDWRNKENKMLTIETQSLKKMRMVLLPYDDLEEKLTEWVLDFRNNGHTNEYTTSSLADREREGTI